ncbi:hypothetical protein [Lysobacter sp. CA199]|uniref:hypothetical protein n=1 Tax=Lysobacter sp. CA199 TaxID=3455608 RepID=UPI003F8D2653
MIEFAVNNRAGVELRVDRADAQAWLQALRDGTLDTAAVRDGRGFVVRLQPSAQEWIRIEALRCLIAVDGDSLEYLRDRLEAFVQVGHFSPAELWHMREVRTGRERTVFLLKAEPAGIAQSP